MREMYGFLRLVCRLANPFGHPSQVRMQVRTQVGAKSRKFHAYTVELRPTSVDLRWVVKRWKTCVDLRTDLSSTKGIASQRKWMAKRNAGWMQVQNLVLPCEFVWLGLNTLPWSQRFSRAPGRRILDGFQKDPIGLYHALLVPVSHLPSFCRSESEAEPGLFWVVFLRFWIQPLNSSK